MIISCFLCFTFISVMFVFNVVVSSEKISRTNKIRNNEIYIGKVDDHAMMYALKKSINKPGIVIDVGANGGLQSNMALEMNRKVLAIECLAAAYSILLDYFQENQNMTLIHACAGSKHGLNQLHLADDSSSMIKTNIQNGKELSKAMLPHNVKSHNRQDVITVRLDDIVTDPVSMIKIDTQGFEYNVLLGTQSILERYRPVVMFEYSAGFKKDGDPHVFFKDNYNCKSFHGDVVCVPF